MRADVDPLQDSAVLQDFDGEGKIVYLFLPIYKVCSSASLSFLLHTSDFQCSAEICKMQ